MKLKEIQAEIMKHNDWLNGMVDFRDGDLCALNNAEDDSPSMMEVKTAEETAELLRKWENVNIKYKDLIFMSHWSYGCFVYRLSNLKSYFEHYTIDAFDGVDDLVKSIKRDAKCSS